MKYQITWEDDTVEVVSYDGMQQNYMDAGVVIHFWDNGEAYYNETTKVTIVPQETKYILRTGYRSVKVLEDE